MTKENFEKEISQILSLLKDIDMKVNHIIERLKFTYSYFNSTGNCKK
jgi:hypothetical protein